MAGYVVSALNGVTLPNATGAPTFYAYNTVVPLSKLLPENYQWMVLSGILSETENGFGGGGGSATWGSITGTLSTQTDLQTALNAKLNLSGGTLTGGLTGTTASFTSKLSTAASATGGAGLLIPHGAAPTSPVDGDVWTTTAGMYVRINGTTVGPLASSAGGATWGTITGTLSSQTDLQSALDAKFNSAGGILSGNVTISKSNPILTIDATSSIPELRMNAPTSTTAGLYFRTVSTNRWLFGKNSDPESGSNAGSNFYIYRYDDAGAGLGTALTITRSTGAFTFGGDLTVSKTGAVITASSTTGNADVVVTGVAGNAMSLRLQTAGLNRWSVQKDTAPESGSNAGADFKIWRYTDVGAVIDAPITITRSTGAVSLTGDFVISKANPVINMSGTGTAIAKFSSTSATSEIRLNSATSNGAYLNFMTADSTRWAIWKTNTSESGSNAGSDLEIYRYSDAGAAVGAALTITRSTGTATFSGILQAGTSLGITSGPTWVNDAGKWMTSGALRVDGAIYAISTLRFGGTADVILQRDAALSLSSNSDINISKASSVLTVNASSGNSDLILKAVAGSQTRMYLQTGSTARWSINKNATAESGSNAGSNFEVNAFDDAGSLLSTPLSIARSTGLTTLTSLSVSGTTTLATATSIGSVTSTEIGYLSGVTSSIQTQLNNKAASTHTHLYAGSSSAGGAADSVANSFAVKFDSGTTEGTDLYTFNGSASKTVNIVAGSNITLTESAGQVTIASTGGGGGGTWGSITGTLSSQTDLQTALDEQTLGKVMDIW